MSDSKYSSIHYHSYLKLEELLGAQTLRSEAVGKPAHDEMLFIVTHQVYELWFKEVIHDLSAIVKMFEDEVLDEREVGTAVHLLNRVIKIQGLLIDQIEVMETMTALDFLDFRNYLFPASGFQSFQFRIIEGMLGLESKNRLTYNGKPYDIVFSKIQREYLQDLEKNRSMLEHVEAWLERTPFLETGDFNFLSLYRDAVNAMLEREKAAIRNSEHIDDEAKAMRLRMLGDTDSYFASVFDEEKHNERVARGELRMSYKATLAALLINLYRDEPILRMPYELLSRLVEVDSRMTTWRYRHAQMVLRMLGKKVGTGGSSGHNYLAKTAEKHGIFTDLHNISTLLIPRSDLPELPEQLKNQLGFYFTATYS
ncbi:MAG: tryptophan 2,3-dioxygenase family protein [Bacteroidia bacterium]